MSRGETPHKILALFPLRPLVAPYQGRGAVKGASPGGPPPSHRARLPDGRRTGFAHAVGGGPEGSLGPLTAGSPPPDTLALGAQGESRKRGGEVWVP